MGCGFTSSEAVEVGSPLASTVVLIDMEEQKAFIENMW